MDVSNLPCIRQFNSAKHFLEYIEIDKFKDEPIKFTILADQQMREHNVYDYEFLKRLYKSILSRGDTQKLKHTDLFYLHYRYLIYNCSNCYNSDTKEFLGGNIAVSKLTRISNIAAYVFFKLFFGKINSRTMTATVKTEVIFELDNVLKLITKSCNFEGIEDLIKLAHNFKFLEIAYMFSHDWYQPLIDNSFVCYALLRSINGLVTGETFDRTRYEDERELFLSRLDADENEPVTIDQNIKPQDDATSSSIIQKTPVKDFSLSYLSDFTYNPLPITPVSKLRENLEYSIIPETPPSQILSNRNIVGNNSMERFNKIPPAINEEILVTSSPVVRKVFQKSFNSLVSPDVNQAKMQNTITAYNAGSLKKILESEDETDEDNLENTIKSNSGFNFNILTDTKVNKGSGSKKHKSNKSKDIFPDASVATVPEISLNSNNDAELHVVAIDASMENIGLIPLENTDVNMDMSLCNDIVLNDKGEPMSYGSYNFLRALGRGSFSDVYEAIKVGCSKTFAVKIIKLSSNVRMNEIDLEIQILKKMSPTGRSAILYESKVTRTEAILIMEKAQMNMKEFMESKAIDVDHIFIMHYFKLMMLCVEALHLARMAHLDLKMQNFVITDNSDVKLIDYGTSKVLPQHVSIAENDERVGTVVFMAPEVMLQSPNLNPKRADIWSMGIVLYFMVYQQQPCNATTIIDYMKRMCNRHFTFQYPVIPYRYNDKLYNIMKKCLVYNHEGRPTATEIIKIMTPDYPYYK